MTNLWNQNVGGTSFKAEAACRSSNPLDGR